MPSRLTQLAIASLLTTSLAHAADSLEISKPNIVFILADDLGAKDLGCNGSKFYLTPNIDKLAKGGVNFTHAYAAHPRCVPSRYGIFSGRTPGRDGVPGFQNKKVLKHTLPIDRVTWGEVLLQNGYSTGYIGKWHLGKAGGEPDKQGFTDSRIAGAAGAPASYLFPYHKAKKGKSHEDFPVIEAEKNEHLTDRLTEEALDFIDKNRSKPFALVLAHYAVHTPIEAPQKTINKYNRRLRELGIKKGTGKKDEDIVVDGNAATKAKQNHPTYAAMIEHLDLSVGAVIEKLKQRKLDKNTIIILTSDHGGLSTRAAANGREIATSNAPYKHGKGWLYEGGIRVPLIVKAPGLSKANQISNSLTVGTDHFASILDLASIKPDAKLGLNSKSYVPALKAKKLDTTDLFFHSPIGRPTSTGDSAASAFISYPWKVYQHHESKKVELYNIADDEAESKDLASSNKTQLKLMIDKLNKVKKELQVKHKYK